MATISISTFVNPVFKLLISFLNIIMTGIGDLFSTTFSSLGGAVATMFQSFGFSAASYGILGPTAFVVGILLALIVAYLFLIPGDAEKDVVEAEDEA